MFCVPVAVFCSIIGKKYPAYGTQWHPEKIQFEWEPKESIDHSEDAIRVGQYMANFFVNQGKLTYLKQQRNCTGVTGHLTRFC